MKKNTIYLLIYIAIILTSCSKENNILNSSEIIPETLKKPNVLLIIAYDLGLDACSSYNVGTDKPVMQTLTSLINTGITFNNVWSNPICSPTRSTVLTGKYDFRTSIMDVGDELLTSGISIQKYIDTQLGYEYNQAVIGKWHLSTNANHPTNMGINYYAGSLGGGLKSYWSWSLTENNTTFNSRNLPLSDYNNVMKEELITKLKILKN